MLKNKWLAIALSIAAVILVGYRLFFDKEAVPVAQPVAPLVVSESQGETAQAQIEQEGQVSGDHGALIVDESSPILLKRVESSMEEYNVYDPLSTDFGLDIFIKAEVDASAEAVATAAEAAPLELNGIVIDEQRRLAIVNRQLVGEGEFVAGALVTKIMPGRVFCRVNGREVILEALFTHVHVQKDGG